MQRAHIKDHIIEARQFRDRAIVAALISIVLILVLFVRLSQLQIIDYAHFSDLSENNRVRLMALPPNRGLIYDRNGVVLAENQPTYHLEITPEEAADIDATIAELSALIRITEQDIQRFRSALKTRSPFEGIPLRTKLNDVEVARLAVNRHRFPGVDISARLSRHYPHGASAVHAIGYVSRINVQEMETLDAGNYSGTSHIGKTGLEKFYENELHGKVGHQNVEVNVQGRLLNVLFKTAPVPGNNLVSGLDIRLQQVAEKAMGEFNGSVVAMVPTTGEILALVSMPGYDPNLFVHGIGVDEYRELRDSNKRPLFNRAISGQYPPGSTLKPFIGLAGLDYGVIDSSSNIRCKGYYLLPNDDEHQYRDWKKEGHGVVNLIDAIEQSCDVYYYQLSYRMGINRIHDFLEKFGLGSQTGIDMIGERSGLLPSREWKLRAHNRIWYPGETLISGIGQGYMLTTPLQLVKATAMLANGGHQVRPSLMREIRDANGEVIAQQVVVESARLVTKRPADWNTVIKAMRKVVHGLQGTARATGYKISYKMAGKTGTAQVFGIAQDEEYDEEKVASHLRDHALFIAFAPIDNPQIAVAVIVENGEHGSTTAAPIARKVITSYLGSLETLDAR